MKKFYNNWKEVYKALTEGERAKVNAAEPITGDKIISDVAAYYDEYVANRKYGERIPTPYGKEVPDVIDGVPAFTKANFFWGIGLEIDAIKMVMAQNNISLVDCEYDKDCFGGILAHFNINGASHQLGQQIVPIDIEDGVYNENPDCWELFDDESSDNIEKPISQDLFEKLIRLAADRLNMSVIRK